MTSTPRPATAADLDGVVAVFLGCWHESYPAVLPSALVAAMTRERAVALWRGALAAGAPGEVLVETAPGGEVRGVTRFAPSDDGATGLIHSLYVAPTAQGGGVGAALLTAATGALRAGGAGRAELWAFRDNGPSLAFYRRQGWRPDGATRVQEEFGEPEVRLTRELAAP
ncbi:GNAT family N-acetyltransferase [Streptomyces hainanensis]|uniref:GNAT family N-acetyltransferase n=1 Tax=Streptomyces hainanensis TaxID=402648 RepID=A0A4R4TBD6_9ACTN|nr:GNAT family N-acetyltransferase [Streptomyces hainanensis]TDC73346.1 GNAT family N-acetyltransferase [Streptomyces hainanensis]